MAKFLKVPANLFKLLFWVYCSIKNRTISIPKLKYSKLVFKIRTRQTSFIKTVKLTPYSQKCSLKCSKSTWKFWRIFDIFRKFFDFLVIFCHFWPKNDFGPQVWKVWGGHRPFGAPNLTFGRGGGTCPPCPPDVRPWASLFVPPSGTEIVGEVGG